MSAQTPKPQTCCMDDHEPASLTVEEALRRIGAAVAPVEGNERCALRSALGRVLAEDIRSGIHVPAHDNSSMDGYAVAGADLPTGGVRELKVIGTSWAGKPYPGRVQSGQCVRIMTGAVIPDGADTVVIQERVERDGDTVRVGPGNAPGQNVRRAGEDIAAGQVALNAGKRLMPVELGLLASLGIGEVKVRRRARVAFFSTGDELRSIGEPLGPGEIYDSNRYTLYGMLRRLGVEVIDMGVVRDDREAIQRAFTEAAQMADAVITSGGVSVGEADYVKETLERLGKVNFWKIAMKPGRPLAFGQVRDALFFGLPGNPVSVMATFYQFVQPALHRLTGETGVHTMKVKARCASRLKKAPGRVEFQRGILQADADGNLEVRSTGEQGSGILSSMSRANCFIILPMECAAVEPGTLVDVQPFEGLV
ncbi:MAG: molybdopterin molybdotransferase MoeA [Gammaproteobacteria bacterium]|nr:molybdopterin molybdotransferase MoeA [Gammaproteobacteria bacterium]